VHPFHAYLCEHLEGLLRKCSVIVFYEPRNEFGPFFALRAAVEPIVAADKPEPLILYLPSVTPDRTGSVLMELEKAGTCYEPQLKRLALNVLRRCYTDGQIDEMLRPASVTYEDIVAFLGDGDGGNALSVLDTLFGGAQGEALVTQWAGLRCEGRSTWNTEKTLLPFQNGVLNLATLNLAQYSPAMGFNWCLPYPYGPKDTCPTFLGWLSEAAGGTQGSSICCGAGSTPSWLVSPKYRNFWNWSYLAVPGNQLSCILLVN
jgi:hypothetical protein